jgi:hypothetical protein
MDAEERDMLAVTVRFSTEHFGHDHFLGLFLTKGFQKTHRRRRSRTRKISDRELNHHHVLKRLLRKTVHQSPAYEILEHPLKKTNMASYLRILGSGELPQHVIGVVFF